MPPVTYTKLPLSASLAGKQIIVTGTISSSATPIHTVDTSSYGTLDEIFLYAYNEATTSIPLNILWGGLNEPNDVNRLSIPAQSGRTIITDGKLLASGSITAYASASGFVTVDGFVNRIGITVAIDPVVINWAQRVVTNGGLIPSLNTQVTLTTFLQSLNSASLTSSIKTMNCFVPDGLVAAITPLINTFGNDPWTNNNFTASSDLNGNGMIGNNSNKFLNTGVNPSTSMASNSNGGLTVYVTWVGTAFGAELGSWNSSNFNDHSFDLYSTYNDANSYFDCYGANGGALGGGRLFAANARWLGYVSGNRTSTSSIAIYRANSTASHSTLASGVTSPDQTRPTASIYCFGVNGGGTVAQASDKRLSFAAIHDGLTFSQSVAFFSAVQNMRISLGGGYV